MAVKRETAHICGVADVVNAQFVPRSGWDPNSIQTSFGEFSRVNIMGIVVALQDPLGFLVDDGSASILVRAFEAGAAPKADVGSIVTVIGRPRTYQGSIFIFPEIVKRTDPTWLAVRRRALRARAPLERPEPQVVEVSSQQEEPVGATAADKVIAAVRSQDKGKGAPVDGVEEASKVDDFERILTRLIEEGELFYVRPGALKVLE
ncbi:MAG: hypothetical protein ABIH41_03835 [Nanoarchaeota archaeon]